MNYCFNCGARITDENQNFCIECGADLKAHDKKYNDFRRDSRKKYNQREGESYNDYLNRINSPLKDITATEDNIKEESLSYRDYNPLKNMKEPKINYPKENSYNNARDDNNLSYDSQIADEDIADENKLYKDDIIRILHEYNLDPNRYTVITGAAMVLYGMKEFTRDIDISVSKDYYNELLSQYKCTFERVDPFGECIFFIDDIINFGTTYYSNEIKNIEGIPVLNEERLINIKEFLGRDKDINDLSIIKR